mgnify:CR=1 FL=1
MAAWYTAPYIEEIISLSTIPHLHCRLRLTRCFVFWSHVTPLKLQCILFISTYLVNRKCWSVGCKHTMFWNDLQSTRKTLHAKRMDRMLCQWAILNSKLPCTKKKKGTKIFIPGIIKNFCDNDTVKINLGPCRTLNWSTLKLFFPFYKSCLS